MGSDFRGRRSWEERLRAARARGFAGRDAERALFRSAMEGDLPAAVLWIYGPGGIGKSALLEQFADDARAAGRRVVRIDGREIGPSPQAFAAEASEATGASGAVVLVDTFERCGDLEGWLRRDFVPALPQDAMVVVASRQAPGPGWRADLGWSEMLRVIALRNLPPQDAASLLEARGVPADHRVRLLAFAGGHPLALSLAAKTAQADASARKSWTPGHDVIRTLLSELVGAVPSAARNPRRRFPPRRQGRRPRAGG